MMQRRQTRVGMIVRRAISPNTQIIMVMQSLLLNTQDPFKQNMQQWRTIHSQSLIHPFI